MATLQFLGATGTVTGSRFFLDMGDVNFLVDCGLFQGTKKNRLLNWEPFPIAPRQIDNVLLTHAHIDHAGYLPRLCKQGFAGPIYSTHGTSDLCEIMLKDSAHLQEEDARWANKKGFSKHKPALPLYTVEDAEKALSLFSQLYYEEDLNINNHIRIKFKDAGHILGSAFIDLKVKKGNHSRKIVFSGDFGRAERPILKDPVQPFNVDYLVLESTYGDRLHDHKHASDELARVINESMDRGGVLVIPAFAVGRTQTLLYVLRELEDKKTIPSVPVFIDSPMAIDTTDIFRKHMADLDLPSRILTLEGKEIFKPRQLHICRTREQSIAINKVQKSAIIISASGMVTGGRILHHLKERLPDERHTVLMIGYQAEGTRGRTLLEGKPTVKIHGQHIPINAKVENISGFSAHGDYNEILAWLMGFNKPPEKTFLVHGEPETSKAMGEKITRLLGWDVIIPELNETIKLNL